MRNTMNRIFAISLLLFVSVITHAQEKASASVIKTWKLTTHTMKGVGKHNSLPKDTRVEFLADGTWMSTSPWQGISKGKWILKNNNRTLQISFLADDETEFRVARLTDNDLELENITAIAKYKLSFEALR